MGSCSEHLRLEIAVAQHRGYVPGCLPPSDDLLRMIEGMGVETRRELLDAFVSPSALPPGAPVPGCPCPICTGIPADHPARTRKRWSINSTPGGYWTRQVEEARSRPILEVARSLGLEVRRAGKGWMARCPFHEDKTPSLSLTPEGGVWHCFGCGRGGDGIALVRAMRGLGFRDAVRELTV